MRSFLLVILQAVISGGGVLPFAVDAAPTVSLTASPSTGVGTADVTLTWSSTGASACVASGAWTGAKALTGTQVVPGVAATSTFTLTCTEGSSSAVLSWTAPTQNTDGSALTNLASYKVYHAATSAGVGTATPVTIAAPALTYTVSGLAAGTRYFGIKAVNSAGVESDMSNVASKAIVLGSAATSTTVTISTKPNAPSLLTVEQVVKLYDVNRDRLGMKAGTVALGTACGEVMQISKSALWATVDAADVKQTFWGRVGSGPNTVLVAKCA